MARFDDEGELLEGLLSASFRGVRFFVPDATHEVGRRIVSHYFPGLDGQAHDDLGRLDGPITLAGMLVGADYVAQAARLGRALQAPGAGTLVHPWLGEMRVVVSEPAQIAFKATELRVTRFEAVFALAGGRLGSGAGARRSTLARLVASADSLTQAPATLVTTVLGGPGVPVGLWAAGRQAAAAAIDLVLIRAAGSRGSDLLAPLLEVPRGAVAAAGALAPGPDAARAIAAGLALLSDPFVQLARAPDRPAIAPGGSALPVVGPSLEPRRVATLALSFALEVGALERDVAQDAAVLLAAEVALLAAAARAVSEIDFESRQDAAAWRDEVDAGLGGAAERVALLAPAAPDPAARLWSAVALTRAELSADLNEVIGRLPAVRRFTPPATVSAFLVAQHLVGDDPERVVPTVDDLVRRNRLRHPALVPPEPVEYLA